MQIKEETNCRVCEGKLKVALDLGNIYPSAFLKDDEVVDEGGKAPLVLAECEDCGLVQLKHTVDLDSMYRQYWYSSSLNKSMVSSLDDVVRDVESKISLDDGDVVVDIGCNDGTMLQLYTQDLVKVGFDPALNLKKPDCIFINDYFSYDKWSYTMQPTTFAKVVTAVAMFYDLPHPHDFVEDVKSILADDGIFVIQFTDLVSMFQVTAFDNICHEHLEYYKVSDVEKLLKAHGLAIVDISHNNVNGGSIRITAAHEGKIIPSPAVNQFLIEEFNYLQGHDMEWFKGKIETVKMKVKSFLQWAKGHNHRVYLLGASTKGNTLLQVCDVTSDLVPYAAEVNKDKFGLRTAGSDIKIISEDDALVKHPDYFLVPVWHFKNSILNNPKIRDYVNSNGRLLFPLPEFTVYTTTGGYEL